MPIKVATKTVKKVRAPKTSAKKMPNQQKPVKTPMKVADRKTRAKKAVKMVKRGAKGPVNPKSIGIVSKPKLAGNTRGLRK